MNVTSGEGKANLYVKILKISLQADFGIGYLLEVARGEDFGSVNRNAVEDEEIDRVQVKQSNNM